jgi:hypothetical protein
MNTARLFNSSHISPRKCRTLLTKIAVLLFTGERFPTDEATTLFFGISKLFQNKDPSLRQMVYLILKELAGTAEDVIMSTSIIMKDASVASDVLYRANAIRALCRIIDVRADRNRAILFFFRGIWNADWTVRLRPFKALSDLSRLPLSIKLPRFPPLPWCHHIIFSPLPRTSFEDGRVKHKRLRRRPSSRPAFWVLVPAVIMRAPYRRRITCRSTTPSGCCTKCVPMTEWLW